MNDDSRHARLADALLAVEMELRRLHLWTPVAPSAEALASPEPFCHDTLSLPEWLQFVCLPRMAGLVEAGAALPEVCAIRPLAEETLGRGRDDTRSLLRQLGELDTLLTHGRHLP